MSKVVVLSPENFQEAISAGVVAVDFYADWCGPCKMLAPILEEVAETLGEKAKICKINSDQAREIAIQYEVRAIPNVCIFKDGALVDRIIGFKPAKDVLEVLNKHI